MEEKKLQEMYLNLQLLDQQIKQTQKQVQVLNNQLVELSMTKQSLDDLKEINKGTEILVPISSGIYSKAELKDNNELIVNVGSNVTVKKNIEETKKLVNDQIEELAKIQIQMNTELEKLISNATSIEKEINQLASEK
jgi:prefoldin alpha subunit